MSTKDIAQTYFHYLSSGDVYKPTEQFFCDVAKEYVEDEWVNQLVEDLKHVSQFYTITTDEANLVTEIQFSLFM